MIKTITYKKDCEQYFKWPSLNALPDPQVYPVEDIVVCLGLKLFNSDNNSTCIPAEEMHN